MEKIWALSVQNPASCIYALNIIYVIYTYRFAIMQQKCAPSLSSTCRQLGIGEWHFSHYSYNILDAPNPCYLYWWFYPDRVITPSVHESYIVILHGFYMESEGEKESVSAQHRRGPGRERKQTMGILQVCGSGDAKYSLSPARWLGAC